MEAYRVRLMSVRVSLGRGDGLRLLHLHCFCQYNCVEEVEVAFAYSRARA